MASVESLLLCSDFCEMAVEESEVEDKVARGGTEFGRTTCDGCTPLLTGHSVQVCAESGSGDSQVVLLLFTEQATVAGRGGSLGFGGNGSIGFCTHVKLSAPAVED